MNTYEQATQEVRDAFAALCKGRVEAAVLAEREACAKVCVKIALEFKSMYCGDEMEAALICENTIRARSQA